MKPLARGSIGTHLQPVGIIIINFILEQPWAVLGIGFALVVIFFGWWIQSGAKEAVYAMLAVIVLTAVGFGLGLGIETENEALRRMLFRTAESLEQNRVAEIDAAIHSRPSEAVLAAQSMLASEKYQFTAARIKKIHAIDFSGDPSNRRAIVRMNVFVEGNFNGFTAGVPRYVELTLYRQNEVWKVQDFIHDDALAGFQGKDGMSTALPNFN